MVDISNLDDNTVEFKVDSDRKEQLMNIDPIHRDTAINYGLELLFSSNLFKSFFKKKSSFEEGEVVPTTLGIDDLGSESKSLDLDAPTTPVVTQEAPKEELPTTRPKIKVGFEGTQF